MKTSTMRTVAALLQKDADALAATAKALPGVPKYLYITHPTLWNAALEMMRASAALNEAARLIERTHPRPERSERNTSK